jgi:hypothetical protein
VGEKITFTHAGKPITVERQWTNFKIVLDKRITILTLPGKLEEVWIMLKNLDFVVRPAIIQEVTLNEQTVSEEEAAKELAKFSYGRLAPSRLKRSLITGKTLVANVGKETIRLQTTNSLTLVLDKSAHPFYSLAKVVGAFDESSMMREASHLITCFAREVIIRTSNQKQRIRINKEPNYAGLTTEDLARCFTYGENPYLTTLVGHYNEPQRREA